VSIDVIAEAAAGPFAAACALLAYAGGSKVRRPSGVVPAAAALRLPSTPRAIRTLGVVEIGAATAGLALGGFAAAAVAAVYGVLAIAAWRLYARAPGTACGCLGQSDAPVTAAHIAINVVAAAAAALAATAGPPLAAAGTGAWSRVAFVVLVACCAWLAASVLDALPALGEFAREGSSR
jgi:hypothetical protein